MASPFVELAERAQTNGKSQPRPRRRSTLPPSPAARLCRGVVDYLAPRALLLVLDNCEHVLPASAALCDALLRARAGAADPHDDAGASARRRRGGLPRPVAGDPAARARVAAPEELLRYEAVALFAERAAAAVPGFALDEENARRCRAHLLPSRRPAAGDRAGGRAPRRARHEHARRSPGRPLQAAAGRQPHGPLAPADAAGDARVEPRAAHRQRAACCCGAWRCSPVGFDLGAAETVCAGGELERDAVVDVLARLVEKSLVAVGGAGRELRYRLLETVRLYAARAARGSGRGSRAVAQRQALVGAGAGRAGGRQPAPGRRGGEPARARTSRCRPASGFATASRCCRSGCGESTSRSLTGASPPRWRRRPSGRSCARNALIAASAIDYRAGTLACGEAPRPREPSRSPRSWALAQPAVARPAAARRNTRSPGTTASSRRTPLRAGARGLRTARASPGAEALSIYSIGVARWLLGDLDRRRGAAHRERWRRCGRRAPRNRSPRR